MELAHTIENIKRRARADISKGALTPGYKADVSKVIALLNQALASEIVCVLRYRNHVETARGIQATEVAAEFEEHAKEEQQHGEWLAERIAQLDGNPDYNPQGLRERAATDYVECSNIQDMLKENLIAERIAIDFYREVISYLGDSDPTTRRLLEKILEDEEEHADDLAKLLP